MGVTFSLVIIRLSCPQKVESCHSHPPVFPSAIFPRCSNQFFSLDTDEVQHQHWPLPRSSNQLKTDRCFSGAVSGIGRNCSTKVFKLCPYFNCPVVLGNLFCSFSSDPTDYHWVSEKGLLQVKIKMIYKTCKLAKTFRKPTAEVSPEIIGKYSLTPLIMCSIIVCHKTITLLSIVTC